MSFLDLYQVNNLHCQLWGSTDHVPSEEGVVQTDDQRRYKMVLGGSTKARLQAFTKKNNWLPKLTPD